MGKKLTSTKGHKSQINDMQCNKDGTMFVTASKDNMAKLFDSESLMLLKTYKTERPVNSATISPILDHVNNFLIEFDLFFFPLSKRTPFKRIFVVFYFVFIFFFLFFFSS